MDPNETLKLLLQTSKAILGLVENLPDDQELSLIESQAMDCASYIESLDGWLSSGGFLPKKWERPLDKGRGDWPVVRED